MSFKITNAFFSGRVGYVRGTVEISTSEVLPKRVFNKFAAILSAYMTDVADVSVRCTSATVGGSDEDDYTSIAISKANGRGTPAFADKVFAALKATRKLETVAEIKKLVSGKNDARKVERREVSQKPARVVDVPKEEMPKARNLNIKERNGLINMIQGLVLPGERDILVSGTVKAQNAFMQELGARMSAGKPNTSKPEPKKPAAKEDKLTSRPRRTRPVEKVEDETPVRRRRSSKA